MTTEQHKLQKAQKILDRISESLSLSEETGLITGSEIGSLRSTLSPETRLIVHVEVLGSNPITLDRSRGWLPNHTLTC